MATSNSLNFSLVVNYELLMLRIFYSQNLLFYYSRCYFELKVVFVFLSCTCCVSAFVICVCVFLHCCLGRMGTDYTYFSQVYVKPYCRIGVYAIGLGLGYLLYVTKRQAKFRKVSAPHQLT